MVQTKNLTQVAARLLVALTVLLPMAAQAQVTWETLTSFRSIRRLAVIDDTLYAATSGGLLRVSEFVSPGRQFIHTDGLGTTDLRDIEVDATGMVWLAGFGRLVRFDPVDPRQYLFRDRDGNQLSLFSIENDGDYIWTGTSIGLVLFSKTADGGQIEDSYTRFGGLNPSPTVFDIELRNDTLWIATSSGLAVAPSADPVLLKSPLTWLTFDVGDYPELGNDTVRSVEAYGDDIYVATSKGAFRFAADPADTVFEPVAFAAGRVVTDLVAENDSLFVYHSGGIGVVTEGGSASLPTTGLRRAAVTGVSWAGRRWVAMSDSGLYAWTGAAYEEYRYTGSPGNDVRTIAYGPDATLTAGFGDKVYAQYDGEQWTPRAFNARDGTMDLLVGPDGNVWAATWGEGLWRLSPDTTINYDEQNSTLTGILNGPRYVVVRSLATDGVNLFASLFQAANGATAGWVPFAQAGDSAAWRTLGATDGITNDLITAIGYGKGQLTFGTMSVGIYMCDLGSDPYTGTTPVVRHYTDDNSRLLSNSIRVITYAPNGEAWIGTNLGISRWDSGIERLVDVTLPAGVGTDVSSIVFDRRGNAWVGTRGGLVRLDATGGEPEVYTTANSELVSDDVRDLWLDLDHGRVYIATAGGISILQTQISVLTGAINEVVPVPNPFIIRSDEDRLTFNLDRPATVSIFSVAGESVAEFSINRPWDGRNDRGQPVSSGAYIYVITDEAGAVHQGKILLIRKR